MFCDSGMRLVRNLKHSQISGIPSYDEENVRACIDEMKALYEANHKDVSEQVDLEGVLIRHSAIERNKRCLLAYHFERLNQCRELRWEFGPMLPKEFKDRVTEREKSFMQTYTRNLASYMASSNLDLTALQNPPKEIQVEVKCLEDYGELETESGQIIQLRKNFHHRLLLSDCEALIRQGVLEHITHRL